MIIINPRREYWPSQDQTSELLFSSLQRYRLGYGARQLGKGDNSGYHPFLLIPKGFQKVSFSGVIQQQF